MAKRSTIQTLEMHLYVYLFSSVILVLSIGTTFYHVVEKLSWVDAYYFSVSTLATVGFGDLSPHTAAGKIFTTFYILSGVGILTSFFSLVSHRRLDAIKGRYTGKQSK